MVKLPSLRFNKTLLLIVFAIIALFILFKIGQAFYVVPSSQPLNTSTVNTAIVKLKSINSGINEQLKLKEDGIYWGTEKLSEGKNFDILQIGESFDKPLYAKDSQFVYYNYLFYQNQNPIPIIEGADPLTFELVNDIYSKDKNHVYFGETIIPNINPKEFRVIESPIDTQKNIFYRDDKNLIFKTNVYQNIDFESFEQMQYWISPAISGFKDKNKVYILGGCPGAETIYDTPIIEIQEADPLTFMTHDGYYSKDQYRVYKNDCFTYQVLDVDPFGFDPSNLD